MTTMHPAVGGSTSTPWSFGEYENEAAAHGRAEAPVRRLLGAQFARTIATTSSLLPAPALAEAEAAWETLMDRLHDALGMAAFRIGTAREDYRPKKPRPGIVLEGTQSDTSLRLLLACPKRRVAPGPEELRLHLGQWIALIDGKIVAYGGERRLVRRLAIEAEGTTPIMMLVPNGPDSAIVG